MLIIPDFTLIFVSLLMIESSTAASKPNVIPPFCKLTLILKPNGNWPGRWNLILINATLCKLDVKAQNYQHVHPPRPPLTDNRLSLGITISNDLKWNKHVSNITSNANSTLGILRRNLRLSSHTLKTHAYQALVRPHLEFASAVWDPHTYYNTQTFEMVQRRAARFVSNRWHNTSSVTGMLSQLEWVPLATRRASTRLCTM